MPGPLLTKAKVHKLQRLLHMQYKPAEIAAELGITADTVHRTYLPAGAPYTTDENGQIWIVGTDFYRWAQAYMTTRARKPKPPMGPDDAWCMHCNAVVKMLDAQERSRNKRNVAIVGGKCAACGGGVNRFVSTRELAAYSKDRSTSYSKDRSTSHSQDRSAT